MSYDTEEWRDEALCAQTDPDLFFPDVGGTHATEARNVCLACPVRLRCMQHAIKENETVGIWGGLSPRARLKLRHTLGMAS